MTLDFARYEALVMDWDGTMVDFPVKSICSALEWPPGTVEARRITLGWVGAATIEA
ncbi:hypothetical protein GCM10010315_33800 [Streptomyces luteosporeus]|uniref:HAD family hydrolase n=1 Tax=Streptomyces luteosporeus TaxID=173856 RepID=A0ABN3TV96_9ACTN